VSRVFVDSSALLTLLDRADPRHDAARVCLLELADADLVTHGYVVAESLAVARRRFGVDGAIALIDDLLPAIDVLAVEPAVQAAAMARFRSSLPSGTSFVDQVSMELMSREAIETAFVFDADFITAGIRVIP
jgi:Predicted nucleic acid-binding protein, contains PIN domain